MRFTEIPARMISIRIKRTDSFPKPLPEGPVVSIESCLTRPGELELCLKDRLIFVKPVSDADTRRLMRELAGGCAYLAQLTDPAADGSVELQIAFFAGECLEMEAVEVGVDEYVERKYAEISSKTLSGRELYEALAKCFCYTHGNQPYFFFFAGPAVDSALRQDEHETNADQWEESVEPSDGKDVSNGDQARVLQKMSSNRPEPSYKNSFCIIGNGIRLVATERVRPDSKSHLYCHSIVQDQGRPR